MKTGSFHLVTEVASCVARREMSILDHWRKTMRPARVSDEAAEGLGLASKADGPEDASCAPGMACEDAGNQRLRAADAITALKADSRVTCKGGGSAKSP